LPVGLAENLLEALGGEYLGSEAFVAEVRGSDVLDFDAFSPLERSNVSFLCDSLFVEILVADALGDALKMTGPDPAMASGPEVRGSEVRGSEVRGSKVRGFEVRGFEVFGFEVHGSEVHGSDVCGSEVRRSEVPGSEVRSSEVRGSEVRGSKALGDKYLGSEAFVAEDVLVSGAVSSLRTSNTSLSFGALLVKFLGADALEMTVPDPAVASGSGSEVCKSKVCGLEVRGLEVHGLEERGSKALGVNEFNSCELSAISNLFLVASSAVLSDLSSDLPVALTESGDCCCLEEVSFCCCCCCWGCCRGN